MSNVKPSAPKGMRDFGPVEMYRRRYIFQTIASVYEKYGFQPLETPAVERSETLSGKYGEEGDRLIFHILNSGDYLKSVREKNPAPEWDSKKMLKEISEKALRYDLTVPFARYVVQHFHELTFPFRRYQIQPVWRADNPQKGRYREFYQCDADVIGTSSLFCEAEFVRIFSEVLSTLKIHDFSIKVNHRGILSGLAEVLEIPDKIVPFTVTLDKLDKIGTEKVLSEFRTLGIKEEKLALVEKLMRPGTSNAETIALLEKELSGSASAQKGLEDLKKLMDLSADYEIVGGTLDLDLTLARGLDYYTGCIFEVKVHNSGLGSIAGGGRYDNLTGIFGMPGISGVGISFGADRIYDILLQRNLFPDFSEQRYKYFFLNFGTEESMVSFRAVQTLRAKNIRAGLYPDNAKMKKQMGYADAVGAEYVCMIGSDELQAGTIAVKNLSTGEQKSYSLAQFLENA